VSRTAHLSVLTCAVICLVGAAAPPDEAVAPRPAVYGPTKGIDEREAVIAPLPAPPGVPPALLRAAEMATANYPTIRNAAAELQASRADLRAARWLRAPSVSVEVLALTGGRKDIAGEGLTADIVAEQPIYNFGRIGGTIDRAEAALLVRVAALDETSQDLALEVSDTYFDLALASRRQVVLEEGLEQHRALLQTIQNRVQQEVSPLADLDLALSRIAQLEQDLEQAKAQRSGSLTRLVQFVGEASADFGNVLDYDKVTMHPADRGAMDRALNCSPRLARFRGEALIAEADAKVAEASILPEVVGQVSHNEVTGTRAGVVLRMQTGAGFSKLAEADAARIRIEAAGFNLATAERQLREALELDFVNNRASRGRAEANAQAAMTSQLVTESYKRQFITGRRTWLDVMNASREATNSKLTLADAETAAMASNARIWLRTCGWQPRPLDSGLMGAEK
jgi:outer membrane protein, adhesin transport system